MNKIILLVFAIVFAAALVFAAAPEDAGSKGIHEPGTGLNESDNETELGPKGVANMTYGSCVSDAAVVKNACYTASKDKRTSCVNATTDVAGRRACSADYKKEHRMCKDAFKNTKKTECGKIKASFMEKLRYSFK